MQDRVVCTSCTRRLGTPMNRCSSRIVERGVEHVEGLDMSPVERRPSGKPRRRIDVLAL